MPIQKLDPPNLEEVLQTIESFQTRFGLSSEEFEGGASGVYVPEEDAADWFYALQQRRALLSGSKQYWKIASGPCRADRSSDEDSQNNLEKLAA